MSRQQFWTSGRDEIDAMNSIGKDQPVCGSAEVAYRHISLGDALFRITIERFSLDDSDVMEAYLKMIDPRPDAGTVPEQEGGE